MSKVTKNNDTLTQLLDTQKQQLQQSRLQNALLVHQEISNEKASKSRSLRWHLIVIGLLLFILCQYFSLRLQYASVFRMFSQGKQYSFECANNDFSPWHIALGRSYSWLAQLILKNAINQSSANFLWYVIDVGKIPTQDWLDNNTWGGSNNPYAVHPLDYLCGSVANKYQQMTGKNALTVLTQSGPSGTPWETLFSSNSEILQNSDSKLSIFINEGFFGLIQWTQSSAESAADLYNIVFGTKPPASSNCNTGAAALNAASSGLSMGLMGFAFGPEVGIFTGLAGLGLGIANGFTSGSSGFC